MTRLIRALHKLDSNGINQTAGIDEAGHVYLISGYPSASGDVKPNAEFTRDAALRFAREIISMVTNDIAERVPPTE